MILLWKYSVWTCPKLKEKLCEIIGYNKAHFIQQTIRIDFDYSQFFFISHLFALSLSSFYLHHLRNLTAKTVSYNDMYAENYKFLCSLTLSLSLTISNVVWLSNCAILTKWIENNLVNGDSCRPRVHTTHTSFIRCECFWKYNDVVVHLISHKNIENCTTPPSIIAADNGINQF